MSAGRICSRSVVVAGRDESVREGARRMAAHDVGTLVVLDEGGGPAGIVTDRDVTVRCVAADLDPDSATIADVMTAPVDVVREDTTIEDALRVMAATGVRRVPVVDGGNRLVGVLALDDVLDLLFEEAGTIRRLIERRVPTLPHAGEESRGGVGGIVGT